MLHSSYHACIPHHNRVVWIVVLVHHLFIYDSDNTDPTNHRSNKPQIQQTITHHTSRTTHHAMILNIAWWSLVPRHLSLLHGWNEWIESQIFDLIMNDDSFIHLEFRIMNPTSTDRPREWVTCTLSDADVFCLLSSVVKKRGQCELIFDILVHSIHSIHLFVHSRKGYHPGWMETRAI